MNYQEHLLFSLLVNGMALTSLHFLGFSVVLSLPVIAAFGIFTLLPDIDSRHSMASKLLFAAYAGLFLVSLVLWNPWGLALAVALFFVHIAISRDGYKHRNIPHTLAF